MQTDRPYVLSIAGLDPSGGAGLLADIKAFEQHGVFGFGVCSALTVQNENAFRKLHWLDSVQIIEQIEPLAELHAIAACKIGIIQDVGIFAEVCGYLKKRNPTMRIVFDPVWKASAGFAFHPHLLLDQWLEALEWVDIITPNYPEMEQLSLQEPLRDAINRLAQRCAVLLKGGHHPSSPGTDVLFQANSQVEFKSSGRPVFPKHGSGCVLSSAIAANLALGYPLATACHQAKQYIEQFLSSHPSLLGHHSCA
jgi:hydroxymethylpyrimidine/phosphomethylpyrimidine kinase